MSNIDTTKIYAFPAVNKSTTSNSRLSTEYNLVSIINRLVNKDSFIFFPELNSYSYDNLSSNPTIKFNIKGYLFEIKYSDIPGNTGDVYAKLNFKDTNTKGYNQQLNGENLDKEFIGLEFSTPDEEIKPSEWDLQILEGGKIPRDSYIKFTADSINLDDGDLG